MSSSTWCRWGRSRTSLLLRAMRLILPKHTAVLWILGYALWFSMLVRATDGEVARLSILVLKWNADVSPLDPLIGHFALTIFGIPVLAVLCKTLFHHCPPDTSLFFWDKSHRLKEAFLCV